MHGITGTISIAIAAAAGLSSSTCAKADQLNVMATGVYEHVLRDLIEPFRAATGHTVLLSVTNAGGVMQKLQGDAPVDVVLTSAAGIDQLAAMGRIDPPSKVEIGRMRLGVAIRPGTAVPALDTADALRAALMSAPHVAYIDPKGGGTSGPFFMQLFERLSVADAIKAKGVPCATGNDIVRALVAGQATIGLTQASELIGPGGVQFVGYLPADSQLISVYSAGIAAKARSPAAARDFIRFVTDARGAERFRQSGWDIASPR
jgi:molybdate transport system substrate-binding protein